MASMRDMQPRVGYRDLLAMPEDGRRYEIHGGELVVVPSPLPGHQIAAGEIFTLLNDYRRRSGGVALVAPLDIVFDEHDVAQPDVVFFRGERRHLVQPYAVTRAAPEGRGRNRRGTGRRQRTTVKSAAHSWGPQWTTRRPRSRLVGTRVAPRGRNESAAREYSAAVSPASKSGSCCVPQESGSWLNTNRQPAPVLRSHTP